MLVPPALFQLYSEFFNFSVNDDEIGPIPVDCKYLKPTTDHTSIGFLDDKIFVTIPNYRLITTQFDGNCVTYAANNGGNGFGAGTPFIRNVYSVFDIDKRVITLSAVRL